MIERRAVSKCLGLVVVFAGAVLALTGCAFLFVTDYYTPVDARHSRYTSYRMEHCYASTLDGRGPIYFGITPDLDVTVSPRIGSELWLGGFRWPCPLPFFPAFPLNYGESELMTRPMPIDVELAPTSGMVSFDPHASSLTYDEPHEVLAPHEILVVGKHGTEALVHPGEIVPISRPTDVWMEFGVFSLDTSRRDDDPKRMTLRLSGLSRSGQAVPPLEIPFELTHDVIVCRNPYTDG